MFSNGIEYHERKTAGVPTAAFESAVLKVFGERAAWGLSRAKYWANRKREAKHG